MKYLIDKKLALVIIAACLLFLLHSKTADRHTNELAADRYPATAPEPVEFSPMRSNERVIYTCRLADEEIPAVQISEVTDRNGRATETIARAAIGTGIEKAIHGSGASWEYKSVAARSGDDLIDVAYEPAGGRDDYEWVLTIAGNEGAYSQRVRDCTEVSDE